MTTRAQQFEALAQAIYIATHAVEGLDEISVKTEMTLTALNDSLRAVGASALEGHVGLPTELSPDVRPGDAAPHSQAQQDYNDLVIGEFQTLLQRVQASGLGGENNFFGHEIELTIGYIRDQRLSAQDAIRRLQAVLWNWQGGLFQEMSSQDRTLAQLAADLERFIVSGMIG